MGRLKHVLFKNAGVYSKIIICLFCLMYCLAITSSQDSSVSIVTRVLVWRPVFIPLWGRNTCSIHYPDRLWSAVSYLVSTGRCFARGYSGRSVKVTTHLHIVTVIRRCTETGRSCRTDVCAYGILGQFMLSTVTLFWYFGGLVLCWEPNSTKLRLKHLWGYVIHWVVECSVSTPM
jgi:hypothetical protein